MKLRLAILMLSVTSVVFAAGPQLGKIVFPVSCSPEARTAFIEGALWLHSFQYEDARAAFQHARKLDSNCAMAYWGEAMSYNHPIWMEQDRDAALESLKRLAATPEARKLKASTQREKDYLGAVEILYGQGEQKDRDAAYASAMKTLHEKYPDDLEAASFYSLSLLGMCEGKRDIPTYMKAAAVAEEVFAKNPMHPGAAHYLIHSYDDPVHAPLGLRAARAYAAIAPAAAHALHMPSHIFLALGMWDKVVSSNQQSWEASRHTSYHALYWLMYAQLQLGRLEDARKQLDVMAADAKKSNDMYSRLHLASMRATYLIESQKWTDDIAGLRVDTSDFGKGKSIAAADMFATGFAQLQSGNAAGAEQTVSVLSEKLTQWKKANTEGVSNGDLEAGEIAEMELRASLLISQGKTEEALKTISDAATREDAMSYDFGPPTPVKPVHELWGEMLLKLNRNAEAKKQFELALQHAPGRRLSEQGLNH